MAAYSPSPMLPPARDDDARTDAPVTAHVLLVEDQPAFEDLLADALRALDPSVKVHTCRGGAEALETLAQLDSRLDLALVDLHLPDGLGIDIVHAVRHQHPQAAVIVISALTSERTVFASIQAGASGYLFKTDTEPALRDTLANTLQGAPPIHPAVARAMLRWFDQSDPRPPEDLQPTPQERATLRLIAGGLDTTEVARSLGVPPEQVRTTLRSVYRKAAQTEATNASSQPPQPLDAATEPPSRTEPD